MSPAEIVQVLALVAVSEPPELPARPPDASGIASVYATPGDRHALGKPACLRGAPLPDRDLPFCAHRTWKCGTVVVLHHPRTRRTALCVVVDRGPYGARLPSGKWALKRRQSDPGTWRGILDLSPGAMRAIGGTGWEYVRAWARAADQ